MLAEAAPGPDLDDLVLEDLMVRYSVPITPQPQNWFASYPLC